MACRRLLTEMRMFMARRYSWTRAESMRRLGLSDGQSSTDTDTRPMVAGPHVGRGQGHGHVAPTHWSRGYHVDTVTPSKVQLVIQAG